MIKAAVCVGDSRQRIREFPDEAKAVAGRELFRVQFGQRKDDRMKMQKFDNVFDAVYDGEEAREMKRRAELAAVLERFIEKRKLSQLEASKQLGVSQPRVNDLLRGRLHRFSIAALLMMMDRAEIQVEFTIKFPKAA